MRRPLDLPYDYIISHNRDNYKNLGYNYRGHIFEKSLSKQVFANPENKKMIKSIERIIFWLVEEVKILKTQFNFAVDKNDKRIN